MAIKVIPDIGGGNEGLIDFIDDGVIIHLYDSSVELSTKLIESIYKHWNDNTSFSVYNIYPYIYFEECNSTFNLMDNSSSVSWSKKDFYDYLLK